jgi:4-hydroxy-L-threonine phosphate dehydrogenase PdxA
LRALARGDRQRYDAILLPTVPLARHIFRAPTRYYKTGVVFLAYLNGLQAHFHMLGGQQSARSVLHLTELFRLADAAGALTAPELAAERMRRVLALAGVDQ